MNVLNCTCHVYFWEAIICIRDVPLDSKDGNDNEKDFIYKDFKIQQRDSNESVAKKWIWVLSVFIAIIPTHLLRQK